MSYDGVERSKKDMSNIISRIGKIIKIIVGSIIILAILFALVNLSGSSVPELAKKSFDSGNLGLSLGEILYVDIIKYLIFILCISLVFISDEKMKSGISNSKKALNHITQLSSKFKTGTTSRESFAKTNGKLIQEVQKGVFLKNSNEKDSENIINAIIDSYSKNLSIKEVKSSATPFLNYQSDKLSEYFSFSKFSQAVLPLIGFAGTILGIMIAMALLAETLENPSNQTKEIIETTLISEPTLDLKKPDENQSQENYKDKNNEEISTVIKKLSLAFDTTLVAILCSLIIRWIELRRLRKFRANLLNREKILEVNLYKKMAF